MAKYFNTEGSCNPKEHYMVKLDDRLERIKRLLVDRKKYFVINLGHHYGKTTTLRGLEEYLKDDYIVLSLDFQQLGTEDFADESTFSRAFTDVLLRTFRINGFSGTEEMLKPLSELIEEGDIGLKDLFVRLSNVCMNSARPIVLMIDEVDSASNNQVFVDFWAQLRSYYLYRERTPIFHSVILAGVYDFKNLKLKLRPESEQQYNSPWNIAAKFKIDMCFSSDQIKEMLEEYEADYHAEMNIETVAEEIYNYTSGYPVLVSSICKYIDEDILGADDTKTLANAWSKDGIERAVKQILIDNIPLFESMIRHLNEYPEMKKMFQAILFQGSEFSYSPDTKEISLACMFGYAVNVEGKVRIANRIFETRLYNYFLSEEELSSIMGKMAQRDKSYFIHDGCLDMDMTLKKFVAYFTEIYGDNDAKFIEDYGRKFFLLYLKPIINGVGNYYIEAQTRDARRTDVIVDYLGELFIVELKIWHGNEYNERGEKQLTDYLEYYHEDKGYMISFNFNKNKKIGVNEIRLGNKTIVEAVV
ncbi:MAG: ATP-binding protein [Lachnospiraceae bacterium]|nr:ATP-binding protein [Lachnospiraceae bacterium]